MYDFYRLELRRGITSFDSFAGALEMYNVVHKHLMQNRAYDKDMQNKTQDLLTVSFSRKFHCRKKFHLSFNLNKFGI